LPKPLVAEVAEEAAKLVGLVIVVDHQAGAALTRLLAANGAAPLLCSYQSIKFVFV